VPASVAQAYEQNNQNKSSYLQSINNAIALQQSYTDNKVAALVQSAPQTLDTIYELANALGADPSFSVTMFAKIGSSDASINSIRNNLATNYYTNTMVDTSLNSIRSEINNQINTDNINAKTNAGLNIGYNSTQDVNILNADGMSFYGNVNIGNNSATTNINLNSPVITNSELYINNSSLINLNF
jgi:hypothetical protein